MNSFNIIGRLVRDPESKQVGEHTLTTFSVAVQRGKDEVDYFDCEAWRRTAEIIAEHLSKGSQAGFTGKMKQDRWENEDGKGRSKIVLVIQSGGMSFVGSKNDDNGDSDSIPF